MTHYYRLFLTNMGFYCQDEYPSWATAHRAAANKGFEVSIVLVHEGEHTTVASYSPIGGFRYFR